MSLNPASADRLLIMEDDPGMGELIAEIARELGFDARICQSVEACRRMYEEFDPTALVLDVVLPGEGAAEVIPYLAGHACTAPIVFVSGLDPEVLFTVERMAQARGLQVAGVHVKPLLVGQIETFLRDMMRSGDAPA